MGVTVTEEVRKNTEFGPISPTLTMIHPAIVIGHMTTDSRTDIHTVKMNILQRASGYSALAEWVPFVQAARDADEQNMEVIERQGQLYYRTIHDVMAGQELCVWYSNEYAESLQIPALTDSKISTVADGNSFRCSACYETFQFPFCARAHVRFRCKKLLSDANIAVKLSSPSSDFPISSCTSLDESIVKDSVRNGNGNENNNSIPSLYSESQTASPISSTLSPSSDKDKEYRSRKRPLDQTEVKDLVIKKPLSELQAKFNSNSKSRSYSSDESEDGNVSAFRKVPSVGVTSLPSIGPMSHQLSPTEMFAPIGLPQSSISFPLSRPPQPSSLLDSLQSMLLPNSSPPFGQLPPRIPVEPLLAAKQPSPGNIFSLDSIQENLRKLLEFGNGGGSEGQPLTSPNYASLMRERVGVDCASRLRAILPFYRPANPMVEKMLQTSLSGAAFPPLNVTQNWCAKCNASFRMTSDLVYHMRSHHAREFDNNAAVAARKKRDDKLRCEFCGESFRERHHLTRHMTSHTEVRQA